MPIDPTGTPGQRSWSLNVTGPDNVEFQVQVYAAISTETQADDVTQSLVNHLAEWPDLVALTAVKIMPQAHAITPDGP